jgi:hypothetical protein
MESTHETLAGPRSHPATAPILAGSGPFRSLPSIEHDREIGNPRAATDPSRLLECRLGLWVRAGVPPRIQRTLAGIEEPTDDPWWRTGAAVQSLIGTGMLVALVGPHGGGKSTLAGGIVYEACWRWMRCRMVTATELGLMLGAARRSDDGEESVIDAMRALDLLVIDEWQDRSGTEHEDRLLKELVNYRYSRGVDTMIVSNLSPERFVADVGPSIADRMRECGGVILCNWPSRRGS